MKNTNQSISEVKNIVALVTGANRGIGRAITERLLEGGAVKVYAAVRRLSSVDELVQKYGERVVPIQFDLTKEESIEAAARQATDVNFVVSNAGVVKLGSPLSSDMLGSLQFQMDHNVYPIIRLAQSFGSILKTNGGGAFVQMNSLASIKNFLPFTGYSASKAAAFAITQGLREEWLNQGTQVISVIAGAIKTDMSDSVGMGEGAPPPSVVADGILEALKSGAFFVYPDPAAQQVAASYEPFAQAVLGIQA